MSENLIGDIGKILVFVLSILSVYLISAKTQRKLPNYLFAAFLILTAIDMTGYFLAPFDSTLLNSLKIASVLLQMPLFYLYVMAACYFNFSLKWPHALHAFPFLVFVGVFLGSVLSHSSYEAYEVVSTIQYYGYIGAVFYVLFTFKRIYQTHYANNHEMVYKWLMRTTILFLIGNSLVQLRDWFNAEHPALVYINLLTSLFALGVICWFVLNGLHNPKLFVGVDKNIEPPKPRETPSENQEDLQRLMTYMETEKPYLDDKLTLQGLASRYELPEKQLSALINQHLGKHFFDFMNHYRIEDAKRLLKEKPDLTVLEILYQVGFNSKSSFYTAFKKETSLTPLAYRKSIR